MTPVSASRRNLWPGRMAALTVAGGPLLATLCLTLFAWRGRSLLGHWPIPWVDDPEDLANADTVSAALYVSSILLMLFAVCTIALLPIVLAFVLRRERTAGGGRQLVLVGLAMGSLWLIGWWTLQTTEGVKWLMD